MKGTRPYITVVIPTYNRANTLPRAIDSVLDQTFSDFELLVVDSGSDDSTMSLMNTYSKRKEIKYIRYSDRFNASKARNIGIKKANSDLISFLDSDDTLNKSHLEQVAEVFRNKNSDLAGVFTGVKTKSGESVDYYANDIEGKVSDDSLRYKNTIGGFSNLTVRKSVFDQIGYLNEEMTVFEDYEFLIRALRSGYYFYGTGNYLTTRYRDTPGRISDKPQDILNGANKLLNEHGSYLTQKNISKKYRMSAQQFINQDKFIDSLLPIAQAIRFSPTSKKNYYMIYKLLHKVF